METEYAHIWLDCRAKQAARDVGLVVNKAPNGWYAWPPVTKVLFCIDEIVRRLRSEHVAVIHVGPNEYPNEYEITCS